MGGLRDGERLDSCLVKGFFDVLLLLLLLPGVKSFLFRFFSFCFLFLIFFFTPEGLIPVNLSDSYIYLHISRSIGIIIVIII